MVRQSFITREGLGRVQFVWTSRGKASYKAQWDFVRSNPDGLVTVKAGCDAIWQSAHASWFEWLEELAPFFWNWSEAYQRDVRDGQRHFLTGPLPVFMKVQKWHRDAASHELMQKKVVQVMKQGYVSAGTVVSSTHYFSMPKGLDDIRMVYNGTSCGLNDVLWGPQFGLPTIKQTTHALLPGYLQCDLDFGKQFPNYYLHEEMRQFLGVDVREVRSTDPADAEWEAKREPGNGKGGNAIGSAYGTRHIGACSGRSALSLKFTGTGRTHQTLSIGSGSSLIALAPGATGPTYPG
jgi:hypothetical protein